jgi:hypothetical protein
MLWLGLVVFITDIPDKNQISPGLRYIEIIKGSAIVVISSQTE